MPNPFQRRSTPLAVLGVAFLSCAAFGAATALPMTASAVDPSPRIIGGDKVTDLAKSPAVVMIDMPGAFCGGARIAPEWVITARHCSDGKYASKPVGVWLPDLKARGGTHVKVTDIQVAPKGDIALLKIDAATIRSTLVYYSAAKPTKGQELTAWGWGAINSSQTNSDVLKTARLKVQDFTDNPFYPGAPDVVMKGINGVPYHGDSGGPLTIDYVVYGVVSGGDHQGNDPQALESFALTAPHAEWIRKTTGVAPAP